MTAPNIQPIQITVRDYINVKVFLLQVTSNTLQNFDLYTQYWTYTSKRLSFLLIFGGNSFECQHNLKVLTHSLGEELQSHFTHLNKKFVHR